MNTSTTPRFKVYGSPLLGYYVRDMVLHVRVSNRSPHREAMEAGAEVLNKAHAEGRIINV